MAVKKLDCQGSTVNLALFTLQYSHRRSRRAWADMLCVEKLRAVLRAAHVAEWMSGDLAASLHDMYCHEALLCCTLSYKYYEYTC